VRRWSRFVAPCWLVLTLALAACSSGKGATPTPTIPAISGTSGLPTSPTLPPTPPTATKAPASAATPAQEPGATATRGAVATGTGRIASATPLPGPLGVIPPGWRVYRGALPFVIAYPPDWIVDESQLAQHLVYFYAPVPDRSTFMVIATTLEPEANPNLDVLRDRWFKSRTRTCTNFAVEETRQERYAGVDFATVGATCDLPDGLAYSYTGIGIRRQVPWIFEFNARYAVYPTALAEVFGPMITTWNIYDSAGR
jgi:hypothetical protein